MKIGKTRIATEYVVFAALLIWFTMFMWPSLTPEEREEWVTDLTRIFALLAATVLVIAAPWSVGLPVAAGAVAYSGVIGPAIKGFFRNGKAGAMEELGKRGSGGFLEGDLKIGVPGASLREIPQ